MSLIFDFTPDAIGRIRWEAPEVVANELAKLAGRPMRAELKRAVNTRSIEQNKALWWMYGEAVADGVSFVELETGQPVFKTREDVHGFGKLNLLRRPVMTNRGEIDLLGTTTLLTVQEFSEYMERLVAKLANYGVYIPPFGSSR